MKSICLWYGWLKASHPAMKKKNSLENVLVIWCGDKPHLQAVSKRRENHLNIFKGLEVGLD